MKTHKMISRALLLFSCAALLIGCGKNSGPDTLCNATDLSGHWVHSYEEDAGGPMTFRPADYKVFPHSRYRQQYIFKEDGTCEWYYLAPDDGHHFREGTWHCDAQDNSVLHIDQNGLDVQYRILELTDDLLRMQPLN